MAATSVPQPDMQSPIVGPDGAPTKQFARLIQYIYARLGGPTDKVDAAFVTAGAAVPQGTQVVASGGLRLGGPLGGDVGLALYAEMTAVANLPTVGVQEGDYAYAFDGRKVGEGSGAGTGVPVWWSNGGWYAVDSGAIVAA